MMGKLLERWAIISPQFVTFDSIGLKSLSLYFDKIYVAFAYKKSHEELLKVSFQKHGIDSEWLTEQGVMLPFSYVDFGETVDRLIEDNVDFFWKYIDYYKKGRLNPYYVPPADPANYDYIQRAIAYRLKLESVNAIPVYCPAMPPSSIFKEYNIEGNTPCLEVILKGLPILKENEVDWEQIVEFRNDPETRKKLINLRVWQNNIQKSINNPHEIAEEIASKLNDFNEHMEYYSFKTYQSLSKTLLLTGAEIIENLAKLNLTKVLEALIEFNKIEINLTKAELQAPGREVAYIADARKRFGKNISFNDR